MMFLKLVALIVLICHLSVLLVLFFGVSDNNKQKLDVENLDIIFSMESHQELSILINEINHDQIIHNEDLFGNTIDFVMVIQIHNRPLYLQEVINSLQSTPFINTTLLIFSHDLVNEVLDNMIQKIKFAKVMQIFYPFSVQTHPDKFPGPDCRPENQMLDCPNITFRDSYGHPRNPSLVQIKHHWWWKANFVFREAKILQKYEGLVLFLEEDHYLAPDFLHCLKLMESSTRNFGPNCWFYSLGSTDSFGFEDFANSVMISHTLRNFGLAFNRTVWTKISEFRRYFCKYDDYNWDWSLRHLFDRVLEDKVSMVLAASRVLHIGSCGTHSGNQPCDPSSDIELFKNGQINLFPDNFYFSMDIKGSNFFRNNGGWGDPRDQQMCMEM